ncbi:MAG: lactate/malate family dehydrogenase [Pseudonocardiaceae bacterium]
MSGRGPDVVLPARCALGVMGAGRVGRAVTAAAVTAGLVSTVLVHSRRLVEAVALATDVADLAATQHESTQVDAVEHPRDLLDCAVLVLCVRARFTNTHSEARLGGLTVNAPLIAGLAQQLRGYTEPVIVVTNPVDLMTRLFAEHSTAPEAVVGVGSNLDSARYRALVARFAHVPVSAITGSVLGEHGTAATICAHATRVAHRPVELPLTWIREQLHARTESITAGIDRTQYGPAGAVLATVAKLLGYADGHEELSVAAPSGVRLGQRLCFAGGHWWHDPPELARTEQRSLTQAETKLAALYEQLAARQA